MPESSGFRPTDDEHVTRLERVASVRRVSSETMMRSSPIVGAGHARAGVQLESLPAEDPVRFLHDVVVGAGKDRRA